MKVPERVHFVKRNCPFIFGLLRLVFNRVQYAIYLGLCSSLSNYILTRYKFNYILIWFPPSVDGPTGD